jgi:hypothetical protein|tara:strand:+ start:3870 stop:4520 length:651 start_codon:yes stop_codon:yes gene_type:complete
MAANEHKNLSSVNRHNPKGFESAINDTMLCKGLGTPGYQDGDLEWTNKSDIKTRKVTFAGYCTLNANYKYPANYNNDNKAPFNITQSYGSPTISAATTVNQSKFFRIGQFCSEQAGTISGATLQVTCSNAEAFTVALVQYIPSSAVTTSYPLVLIEKSVVGVSSDNLVNTYSLASADFSETSVVLDSHLFLMVKANGVTAAPVVYVTLSVQIGYSK